MDYSNKKFGLIVPNKKPTFLAKKPLLNSLKPRLAAFNNDDSSEDEGQKHVNSQIHKEALKKIVKKQTKLEIQKALEQDATVYEYDSIYDDMKDKTAQKNIPKSVQSADKQKKPKYIGSLMKAAQHRTKERQRIEERKIEKEREQEGDEFSDKPEFVTSAYRKRMQEREKEDEEEKRKAAIEDVMDVRKQKDMSGFYKHLLRQQVGEEALPGESASPNADKNVVVENEEDRDTDLSFSSSSESEEEVPDEQKFERIEEKRLSGPESDSEDEMRSHKRSHRDISPTDRLSDHDQDRTDKKDRFKRYHGHSDRRSRDRHHGDRENRDRHHNDRESRDRHRNDRESRDRHHNDRESRDRHRNDRESRDRHRSDRESGERRNDEHDHLKRDRDNSRDHRSRSPERKRERKTPRDTRTDDKHRENLDALENAKTEDQTVQKEKLPEKFSKRTNTENAVAARERYLARKKAGRKGALIASDSD